MGFVIKYEDIRTVMSSSNSQISKWNKELSDISKAINKISSMSTFSGKTANSAKTYLNEVHGLLIQNIYNLLNYYSSKLMLYSQGYYNGIDTNQDTKLSEVTFLGVQNLYSSMEARVQWENDALGSKLNQVADICTIPKPNIDYLSSVFENIKSSANHLSENISQYEQRSTQSLTDVQAYAASVLALINEYMAKVGSVATSYHSGDIGKSPNINELVNRWQAYEGFYEENKEGIQAAYDHEIEIETAIQEEQLAKEREEEGFWQLVEGIALTVVGAALIIGTAGLATPFVIAAGCTCAYGLAEAFEGGENVYYGAIGDTTTLAFNPLRDTVFAVFGDEYKQTAYDMFGNISSAVAGVGVGKVVIGTTKGVACIAIKEGVQYGAGVAVGECTSILGERYDLTPTQKALISLTAGIAVGGGIERAYTKVPNVVKIPHYENIEGGTSFKYEHNPSENPKVLKDAIEDPNAVYGYRPREDGSLSSFTNGKWDDPIAVEGYKQDRIAYHNRNEGAAQQIVSKMFSEGASQEDVAKAVNEFRNQSRINSYIDSSGNIKNIDGYNAALIRAEKNSYDNLIKSGKTPEQIIKSATKGNPAMDACTGLYDIYFDTY